MSNGNSLINFGDLSKPATVLIKKIAEATGGIFKPWQIRRVAQAEADAKKILASAQIDISDIEDRALQRLVSEEAKNQINIEKITALSLPQLNENVNPDSIDNDWITNFFDKCRIISDDEMQKIWSKVLAGEANMPGTFSKRTVNFMSSLDKNEARIFLKLCSFNYIIGGYQPLVYDTTAKIYTDNGLKFIDLTHLDAIGLVSFDGLGGYELRGPSLPKILPVSYGPMKYKLILPTKEGYVFKLGKTLLTQTGLELAKICEPEIVPGFNEYIIETWKKDGIEVQVQ